MISDHVRFTIDGHEVIARPGQSVAAALWAAGYRSWRRTAGGRPRGLFCGIGLCFDCLAAVDGCPAVRLCRQVAAEGMQVLTEGGAVDDD
jgi:predicted molibdopterin-dependent oxidoreductase YjgC